jgi:hypothetical protein
MKYANIYLLAKAWHLAQIFPPSEDRTKQINTAVSWYLWQGNIFRLPLSTLYKPKRQGGWGLINMKAKCRTLQIRRLEEMGRKKGSETAIWFKNWNLLRPSATPPPPNKDERLNRFNYLQKPALDSAYVTRRRPEEDRKKYRRRIYGSLITLLQDTPNGREMSVEKKWKGTNWQIYGRPQWRKSQKMCGTELSMT